MPQQPTELLLDRIYITSNGSAIPDSIPGISLGITQAGSDVNVHPGWAKQDMVITSSHYISNIGQWRTDIVPSYEELGEALVELKDTDSNEWKLDTEVYDVAKVVASELMSSAYPTPKLFMHGSQSVVFYWGYGPNSLYLTVSSEHLSVVASNTTGVILRAELPKESLTGASILYPALESARSGGGIVVAPKKIIGSGVS